MDNTDFSKMKFDSKMKVIDNRKKIAITNEANEIVGVAYFDIEDVTAYQKLINLSKLLLNTAKQGDNIDISEEELEELQSTKIETLEDIEKADKQISKISNAFNIFDEITAKTDEIFGEGTMKTITTIGGNLNKDLGQLVECAMNLAKPERNKKTSQYKRTQKKRSIKMINRIIEKNVMAVEIDGIEYPLNTDFRDCLKIILAFEDKSLMPYEQQNILLENLYGDLEGNLPKTLINYEKAYELGIRFLDRDNQYKNTKVKERYYSFHTDSEDIASAILNKPNGISLNDIEYLHWWDFMLNFMGMGESSFSNLVYLRHQVKKGKLSKEERQQCNDIGWDIINMENSEEKQAEIQTLEDYFNSDDQEVNLYGRWI